MVNSFRTMPDNYCAPCGVSHTGLVNEKGVRKTSSERRTTRSATAAAKSNAKPSNKMDMATALAKEEKQPVHELVHTESEESDEEERKLAVQLRSLERKTCMAEMRARSWTLTS